jgi:hypothetical protein
MKWLPAPSVYICWARTDPMDWITYCAKGKPRLLRWIGSPDKCHRSSRPFSRKEGMLLSSGRVVFFNQRWLTVQVHGIAFDEPDVQVERVGQED